jgi:hypothetical protein
MARNDNSPRRPVRLLLFGDSVVVWGKCPICGQRNPLQGRNEPEWCSGTDITKRFSEVLVLLTSGEAA